jgi:osmoprotectant transport system permease protein
MDMLGQAFAYLLDPANNFPGALATHLELCGLALALGFIIAVPLGIWISRYALTARLVVNLAGILRVIPSLAVLFLLLPSQGIGFRPSAIALTLLAIPPLLINTEAGMRGVDPAVVESGRGMGMSGAQLLRKVQMPLAMPVVLTGVRTAAVELIASATLATLIGGGGLGDYIATGLALSRNDILLAGAIPVAILALLAEVILSYVQRRSAARLA